MCEIKISVDVNINFSEQTKSFLSGLLSGSVNKVVEAKPATTKSEAPAPAPAPAAEAKPEAPKPATPAKPAATKPAAEVKSEAPEAGSTGVTLEAIRELIRKNVDDHREEIKQKLTELGAPSATKLSPDKYEDMYNFLAAL